MAKGHSRTVEGRENRMIALAIDLAEKQLMDGSASSQVITHYLKLGSTKERLEKEKLEQENAFLRAKTAAVTATQRDEAFYEKVMEALTSYGSVGVGDDAN